MATNYSGFAQGFQGGFGLMQGAINDQRQNELEQSRLEETKRSNNLSYELKQKQLGIDQQLANVRELLGTAQAANLDADTAEVAPNAASQRSLQGSQANNLDAETEEIPADAAAARDLKKSQSENLDAETNVIRETGIESADAANNLKGAQADNLDAQTEGQLDDNAFTKRQRNQVIGAQALQLMAETAQDVIDGTATPEQYKQMMDLNKDSITDAGFVFDPAFDMTLAQFQTDLQDGNFDGSSGVDLLNAIARSTNKFNIGAIVDETFVNAPPEVQSGGYKVISSEFIDFRQIEGGITGTIMNVVEAPDGSRFMYTAPNTAGRNTADGEPLVLPVDDLMASVAGITEMKRSMVGMKGQMKNAARIAKFGNDDSSERLFIAEVDEEVAALRDIATNDASAKSPIPGMSMQAFVDNDTLMREYVENQILFDYDDETYSKESYLQAMEFNRNSEDGKLVQQALGGKPLTLKELESVQMINGDRRARRQVIERLMEQRRARGEGADGTGRRGDRQQLNPRGNSGGPLPAPAVYGG